MDNNARETLKRHFVTLADLGHYSYIIDNTMIFEVSGDTHPALRNSKVSHVVIFPDRLGYGVTFLELTQAPAVTRLPVHEGDLRAETYLPVDFGAVYIVGDPD